ncbi:copper chaperone [Candidatus Microgenomates bacterium]|nr:MAG: copper chaperone [Candidatus Microgenomates bacterium]
MKTVTLNIIGMHCTSCAINIDFELEDLEGVKEATTNYAKQQTVVSYDPKITNLKNIEGVIQKLDYECCSV